jgi:mRNA interferase MazF
VLIVSPDELNSFLHTVIVAPLTSTQKKYPTRVAVTFNQLNGQMALDQLRTLDKTRLYKKLGTVDSQTSVAVKEVLLELFR